MNMTMADTLATTYANRFEPFTETCRECDGSCEIQQEERRGTHSAALNQHYVTLPCYACSTGKVTNHRCRFCKVIVRENDDDDCECGTLAEFAESLEVRQ